MQLNSNKTKVVKYASLDMPPNLITGYKVSNTATLAKFLKDAWKKYGFKEKYVGIVVPEFSTFTKSVMLPKLSVHELNEAVRWQSSDFLPQASEDMTMDWKIIKTIGNEYQVLVAAIPTEVLAGYSESFESAGLSPIAVETPSLSLVRVATRTEQCLLIYSNSGEAILIAAEGQRIMGSVVVGSSDQNAILISAIQMSKHYESGPPKKILIGGLEISKKLHDDLVANLKLPVEWIKMAIGGLTQEALQEYLVPISMQLKDPTEPDDENTINLLPVTWVKQYENKRFKRRVSSLLLVTTAATVASLAITAGSYLFMGRQITTLSNLKQESGGIPVDLENKVKAINISSEKIIKAKQGSASAITVINKINEAKNQGIRLSKFDVVIDEGQVLVAGRAVTREDLINFKQTLEKNKDFGPIQIPISVLEKEKDIDFELNLVYLPTALKKGQTRKVR